MQELLVVVTMDCEKPNDTGLASVTGPRSWEDSERFIEGYAALAAEFDFPVSFFIHPELAKPHKTLFDTLGRAGCEVSGLHLHPWKYRSKYLQHLGHMNEVSQRAVLKEAVAEWSDGFGKQPLYFRPGTFSANDATFRVVADLGFVGGSVSVPGRVFPDLGAVWAGCPPDPHLADPDFRMRAGTLRFANMPLTVDAAATRSRGLRSWHPDLRPDQEFIDVGAQVESVIRQILRREPKIPVLNIVTHNDNDYDDPRDAVRRNFIDLLTAIRRCAAQADINCRGATIAEVCSKVFELDLAPVQFTPA